MLVVIVVAALWFGREGTPSQRIDPTPDPAVGSGSPGTQPRIKTRRAVNRDGGYSFRYPRTWRVTKIGVVTELKAPGSRTVVDIGRGTKNPPRKIANALFNLTRRLDYKRVRRVSTGSQRFAGGRAYLIAARAVNRNNVRLRILFVAVDRGARSFPITIFTAEGTDPARVLPRVEAIAASVRPLTER